MYNKQKYITKNIFVLLDDGVHDRLREHGLVNLIVAILPVADKVNDDILVPGGPPLGREVGDQHHRLGIVGVDVEDGSVDDSADIGAVGRGAGVARIRGEPDLVVGHNVDCALVNCKCQAFFINGYLR